MRLLATLFSLVAAVTVAAPSVALASLSAAVVPLRDSAACLTEAPLAPCATGRALPQPLALAVAPDGRNLYAISGVPTNTSYALASPVVMAAFARQRPSGRLRQLNGTDGCLGGGRVDCEPIRGLREPQRVADGPADAAVSPDGRNVYATWADRQVTSVAVFARDPVDGRLRQLGGPSGCLSGTDGDGCAMLAQLREPSQLAWNQPAAAIAITPDGRAAYVITARALLAFRRDRQTGALSPVSGAPGCVSNTHPGCTRAPKLGRGAFDDLAVSPDGRDIYATAAWKPILLAHRHGAAAALWLVGCSTRTSRGRCAPGSFWEDTDIALSPDGNSAYLTGLGFDVLRRDRTTGVLRLIRGPARCLSPVLSGPNPCLRARVAGGAAVAVSPDGRAVYIVASSGEDPGLNPSEYDQPATFTYGPAIGAFTRASSGLLQPVAGRRGCIDATGVACLRGSGLRRFDRANHVVVSPDNRNVYAAFVGITAYARAGRR